MNVTQVVLALLVGMLIGAIFMGFAFRFRKSTGRLLFTETEDGRVYTLQLEEEPEELIKRRYILFRVSRQS
jgi:hypothetical protein